MQEMHKKRVGMWEEKQKKEKVPESNNPAAVVVLKYNSDQTDVYLAPQRSDSRREDSRGIWVTRQCERFFFLSP